MLRNMKKFLFLLVFSAFSLNAEQADEEAVLNQLHTYYQTFKTNDVKQVESFWTEDAELSLPGIGDLEGREEIAQRMLERFNQNPDGTVHVKSVKVTFPEKDQAVVTGYIQFEKNGHMFEQRAGKIELIKENGKWLLDDVEETSSVEGNGKTLDFPLTK